MLEIITQITYKSWTWIRYHQTTLVTYVHVGDAFEVISAVIPTLPLDLRYTLFDYLFLYRPDEGAIALSPTRIDVLQSSAFGNYNRTTISLGESQLYLVMVPN